MECIYILHNNERLMRIIRDFKRSFKKLVNSAIFLDGFNSDVKINVSLFHSIFLKINAGSWKIEIFSL